MRGTLPSFLGLSSVVLVPDDQLPGVVVVPANQLVRPDGVLELTSPRRRALQCGGTNT